MTLLAFIVASLSLRPSGRTQTSSSRAQRTRGDESEVGLPVDNPEAKDLVQEEDRPRRAVPIESTSVRPTGSTQVGQNW